MRFVLAVFAASCRLFTLNVTMKESRNKAGVRVISYLKPQRSLCVNILTLLLLIILIIAASTDRRGPGTGAALRFPKQQINIMTHKKISQSKKKGFRLCNAKQS